MTSYSTPLKLGPLTLKNRVIMASLTSNRNPIPGPLQVKFYAQRAGAGLILSEGILVEELGIEWRMAPGIYTDEQVAGWKKVVDSVHAHNGLMFSQLWHIGRLAHPLFQNGRPNVGPSAVAAKNGQRMFEDTPEYVIPVAIDDPENYVALFKRAAERAHEIGFDGVELNGAYGYLPAQFLDNTSNQRTDKWGGSIENRCRFLLRIIDEMSSVYGADRVGIKLSPGDGCNDMEMAVEDTIDTYTHLVKELNARRIAYIQITRYGSDLDLTERGNKLDIFQWRKFINLAHTAFFVNRNFGVDEGAAALESGRAEAIVFGRLYITNPDLDKRLINKLELNKGYDVNGFNGPGPEGYIDYPTYEQQQKNKANETVHDLSFPSK